MGADNKQYVFLELAKELLWWLISAGLAAGVMYPLISKLHYNAVWINGALLLIAITYFRWAIFLRTVYVLRSKWVRFALIVVNVNFFVFVLRKFQGFIIVDEDVTMNALGTPIKSLQLEELHPLKDYFFDEITLTCVACMVLAVALSVRIVLAHWKTAHNRLNAGNEG